jgi:hypothetical protein
MGNICSRSRNETDNFNQPGRIVGSNPRQHAESPRAPVPTKTNWKGTPGRTLSGSDGRNIEQNASGAHENADEARANAAIAAQVRFRSKFLANYCKILIDDYRNVPRLPRVVKASLGPNWPNRRGKLVHRPWLRLVSQRGMLGMRIRLLRTEIGIDQSACQQAGGIVSESWRYMGVLKRWPDI